MLKHLLTLCLLQGLFLVSASAQQFLPPIERYSGSKPGYLVLKTGERVEFTLDDLDRKRGLIVNVAGKTADGKKFSYSAEQIQELGLTPSDYAKLASISESTRSIAKMQRNQVNESARNLVLFYNEQLDEPRREALLQLVNPGFESRIRVYNDPFAAETMGVGFAGVQVTGGMDKSFYVRANGKTFRLKKKDYDKAFVDLFSSCKGLMTKYGKDFAWRDFCYHVFMFDQECVDLANK